jgi:hypothetical protein
VLWYCRNNWGTWLITIPAYYGLMVRLLEGLPLSSPYKFVNLFVSPTNQHCESPLICYCSRFHPQCPFYFIFWVSHEVIELLSSWGIWCAENMNGPFSVEFFYFFIFKLYTSKSTSAVWKSICLRIVIANRKLYLVMLLILSAFVQEGDTSARECWTFRWLESSRC